MRTKKNNIVELYEDNNHGKHSNVGLFSFKNPGDKLHLTFYQDN